MADHQTTFDPTLWNAVRHANPDCAKCHGAGHYLYDHNHGKPCELCCPHDKGWWLLKEHYGSNNGKWSCMAGCGFVREDQPVIVNV